MIKAVQGDPDDDEGCYYAFCEADYFEIPNLLEDESFRTFKQAVDEDLPLDGFLDASYEEWYTAAFSGE